MESLILVSGGIILHFIYMRFHKRQKRVGGFQSGDVGSMFGGSDSSDQSDAAAGITAAGNTAYSRSQMTDAESAQYSGSFDIGNELKQIYEGNLGTGSYPTGYKSPTDQYLSEGGDVASALYKQTLAGVTDPNSTYMSTLTPQLQLTEDYINSAYNTRGLMGSGLNIEQMGRTGSELAINEANAMMQNRQTQMGNATTLLNNIMNLGQTNTSNLSNLYNSQQSSGLTAMQRQATAASNTAQYQSYPYQAQLGNYYGQQAAYQQLPGQALSAGAQLGAAAISA